MKSRTRNHVLAGAVLATAALLGAGATVAANAATNENDSVTVAPAVSDTPIDLSLLSTDQLPADILPDAMSQAQQDGNIDPTSTHLLGENSTGTVWVALDNTGQVCVIVSVAQIEGLGSVSCSTPDQFNTQGISVITGSPDVAVEAYLVPDVAVDKTPAITALEGSASPNLVLGDPSVDDESSASRGSAGDSFPVVLLSNTIGVE
jgi:hypothetical protein